MVVITVPKDEKSDELLNSLVEHLQELKEEASEVRKQGTDLSIVDLLFMDFMPKVKLARATYEEKDIDAVKKALAQIRHEIDLAKTGNEFDAALQKIENAYEHIRNGRFAEAREIYVELTRVYKKMDGEMRQVLYKAALDIHSKLKA
jgi:hypothetical protein